MNKHHRVKDTEFLKTHHSKNCIICGRSPCDPCHIKSKGSGGHDVWWNVVAMCREHHTEQHKIGWDRMRKKYSAVGFALHSKGWEISSNGKLSNPKSLNLGL